MTGHLALCYSFLMSITYYEDVNLYDKTRSAGYALTEEEILDFSRKWEPEPYHTDLEVADNSVFSGLVAPFGLIFCIMMKLAIEAQPGRADISALGVEEMRFVSPVRPGDVLTTEFGAISKRLSSSRPDAGIAVWEHKMTNQRGAIVLTCKAIGMIKRRPSSANERGAETAGKS